MPSVLAIYTFGGEGILEYEGRRTAMKRGDVMLADCEKPHDYRTSARTGHWDFFYAHVSGAGATGMCELITDLRGSVFAAGSDRARELFERISKSEDLDSLEKAVDCSETLGTLFGTLAVHKDRPCGTEDRIRLAIERIGTDYGKKLTVDDLCAEAFLSKYHFIKLFRKQTGSTPYEYLLTVRVNRAKQLLRNTSASVAEIGYRCGFEDTSNFIRSFKSVAGTTPLRFRHSTM